MAAVRQVEQNGGYVSFVYYGPRWLKAFVGNSYPFKSPETIGFGLKTTDDELKLVTYLKQTKMVFLNGTEVKGPGLIYLKGMPNLQEVDLTGSAITDKGLQYMDAFPNVKRLTLAKTEITDQGMFYLEQMSNLEELTLAETKVTDLSLHYLTNLPLKDLDIRGTSITSNGVSYLKKSNPVVDIVR